MTDAFAALHDVLAPRRAELGEPTGGGWQRCDALLADGAQLLDTWLDAAAAVYGDRDVAGSFLFWWYVTDVVRPAVLALVVHDVVVPLGPDRTWFHVAPEGWPDAVAVAGVIRRAPDPSGALAEEVVRHLTPLVVAVRSRVRLGPVALWGAVASVCADAFVDGCRIAGRPGAARAEASRFFDSCPQMRQLPDWLEIDGPGGQPVVACRRRVCCLAYRLPGQEYCADCPLAPRSAWEESVRASASAGG